MGLSFFDEFIVFVDCCYGCIFKLFFFGRLDFVIIDFFVVGWLMNVVFGFFLILLVVGMWIFVRCYFVGVG